MENDKATFRLNLQDIYQCMVTKVVNKETVRLFHYSEKLVLIILDKMTRQNDSKFALFWNFKFENQEIIFGKFYTFNLATSQFFFLQERIVYYHRIITEFETRPKEVFLVKCDTFKNTTSSDIVKRSAQQFPVYE